MDPWKELTQETGKVVEACGRMLKRKPPLAKEDLTALRDALNHAAEIVQTIRDANFK